MRKFILFLSALLILFFSEHRLIAQIRVVCVGNSITAGFGSSSAAMAYPAQLGVLLGSGYNVLNAGVSGCTMLKKGDSPYWNQAAYTNALNFDPQIVIISLGTNDSKSQNWQYKSDFYNDYVAMVNSFRANGRNPIIFVCSPTQAFIDNYGITNSIIRDQIIPIVKNVRADLGLLTIDYYNGLSAFGSLFPDGIHPNDQGAAKMAAVAYTAITQAETITPGGIYKLVSKRSNKTLNVSNASVSNGGNVDTWTDTKSDAQRWLINAVAANQYTLTNIGSGKMLHIANIVPANSVNVDINDNTGDSSVKWTITSDGAGYYYLKNIASTAFNLDVSGAGMTDGTNVQLWSENFADPQKWTLIPETTQEVAPTAAIADQVFNAWSTSYNIVNDNGFWGTAEMIEIAEDAYETTGLGKYRDMVNTMYNNFINNHGQDWMGNTYNDDITWMSLVCVRSYLLTGNTTHLAKAKDQFDKMFARANTHQFGGDGLIWNMGTVGTNSCINGPAMVCCCYLAQATGDLTYYDKAITIYNWSKLYLFNASTGKVNDNYNGSTVGTWSSTYNQGTYLGASVMLYDYTKDPSYLTIANNIASFTKNDMYGSGIINNEEGGNDLPGFKGIFMRYARRYIVDCNRADYIPWLQLNAKVAYNNRNSQNIITTQWATRTLEANTCNNFSASTPVSLMINCPKSTILTKDAYKTIESENMDYLNGVIVEPCSDAGGGYNLGGVQNGMYTAYYNVDFGANGPDSASFRLSCATSGGTIEIRLGSLTGKLLGTATITGTGGWANYSTFKCPVLNLKGLQNIYLVYKGSSYLFNMNNFVFIEDKSIKNATVYKDCNFTGTAINLSMGNYTTADMKFNGISDNDISSIKVNPGTKVTLYTDDNFAGTSVVLTADNSCLVGINMNDVVSSFKIEIDQMTGTGNGLRANYFNGQNFETPVYTRIDPTIDFAWGTGSPNAAVAVDNFSARWTGQVQAKVSGDYTFYVNSDNGRRLWVNNVLIVDKWLNDWGTEYSGVITLTKGQKYDIKLEYFEVNGGAEAHLSWSTPVLAKEIIPQTQLYANQLPTVTLTPANNAVLKSNQIINVLATTSDPDGTVSKVVLFDGINVLATITSAPFSYNWVGAIPGPHTISAYVFDNMNAVTVSAINSIQVNDVTAVADDITSGNKVNIYPNPAIAEINVELIGIDAAQLQILDMEGRVLFQIKEKISGRKNIDIVDLAKGVYYVSVLTDNNEVINKKFIK